VYLLSECVLGLNKKEVEMRKIPCGRDGPDGSKKEGTRK
jgi:hypothetical protein